MRIAAGSLGRACEWCRSAGSPGRFAFP